jgi:hypothetical protein
MRISEQNFATSFSLKSCLGADVPEYARCIINLAIISPALPPPPPHQEKMEFQL